ncbi:sorting nexin-14-like isoform X2 [Cimex lectularius]|uniref:Sorting nexin-14-like n=1 Tax=Cimex lectularius TaxID=79782 RepID=A0A8I6SU13_CIMLE|nr:sorting nexin-14-like isoform X2 [Cimex lectularius]
MIMERDDDGSKLDCKFLLKDGFVQSVCIILLIASLTASVLFGFLCGLLVFSSFFLGIVTFHLSFRCNVELSSIVLFLTKGFQSAVKEDAEPNKCNICDDKNCDREKIVHKQKPWAGLMVSEEVDTAIQDLLEKVMEEFIQSWYKKISIDSSFPAEIRQTIRYASSTALSRVLQVDIGLFITSKLIPAVITHINMCIGSGPGRILFHPAVYNRKAELDYLRCKVKEILPVLLEQRNFKCSTFSAMMVEILAGWIFLPLASTADSAILNNLLLLLLGNQNLTNYSNLDKPEVEFLDRFVKNEIGLESNNWALHPDLCNILKDQSLLYAFMQFLKDQGAVHILQFCLDVEEFNKRMLTPELNCVELDLLHRDAWDLFSVYFSPHSPDNIGFPPDLVVQMRKILSKDVTKLRTSRPLFQAYEHAYSLLDKNYCPLFHTSDEFFTWLCGPRTPASYNISGARRSKKQEGTVSKLSSKLHKIKGALRSQTILDGHAYDSEVLQLEADTEFGDDLVLMAEEEERDLSSWKIRINNVDNKLDLSTGKLTPTYTIRIHRYVEGQSCGKWTVERRLADFYTLETKLTEFHGDFPDTQLPPCGLLAPSPPTEPHVYEAYLQKLLSNPSLRGSDLLFFFLTSPGEFSVSDNAFGRLLRKSVPISLRKERGQNIDSFITTFFLSTDSKKSRQDWKDGTLDLTPRRIRCITNTVFKDNLGLKLSNFPSFQTKNTPNIPILKGPSDCLLLLGVKVFKVPNFVVRLALAVHSLLNKPLDMIITYFIEKKVKSLLVPQRIANLINLLQWVVFEKQGKSNPKEISDEVSKKINALKGISHTLFQTVFLIVQNPILNKQLFYTIFDLVIEELFPEILKKG